MSAEPDTTATAPKPDSKKPKPDANTATALRFLLGLPEGVEVSQDTYIDALFKGAGPMTTGQVRRYVQQSGKKVAKVADGILALGLNIAVLKDFQSVLRDSGEHIGLGTALDIVKKEFGVEIPTEVVRILELASR